MKIYFHKLQSFHLEFLRDSSAKIKALHKVINNSDKRVALKSFCIKAIIPLLPLSHLISIFIHVHFSAQVMKSACVAAISTLNVRVKSFSRLKNEMRV